VTLLLVVFVLGFVISVLSGLVGIGGGVILAPALMFVPPIFTSTSLDMKTVSGLTVVQALSACLSGAFGHHKHDTVNRQLVIWLGTALAASAFAGSVASRWATNESLMLLFAGLALVAAAMMFVPRNEESHENQPGGCQFDRGSALAISGGVGYLGGMVGQGGAFILIPLMLHVLKLPFRVVIGSSLAIVACSAVASLLGKIVAGQVSLELAIALALGAFPGAQLGSTLSFRTKATWLHRILAAVIAASAVHIVVEAWFAWHPAHT
jgi:uncharacterized membrane protein YfcA